VIGASIQDVRGLTSLNKQLLKQRGAKGEPENLFREAGKKVITMASAVSRMRKPSDRTVPGPSSTTNTSDEKPQTNGGQQDEQQAEHDEQQAGQQEEPSVEQQGGQQEKHQVRQEVVL